MQKSRLSAKTSKPLVTAGLLLLFAYLIVQDFQKIQGKPRYPSASHFVLDQSKVASKAKTLTLNRLLPKSFDYLLSFSQKKEPLNISKFEEYFLYYQKVVEYLPGRADAQGMLGFCGYYLGKTRQAQSALEKAIAINPQFSGFYYNLGVIYFKQGRYAQAVEALKKAAMLPPKAALSYVLSSREIYAPFFIHEKDKVGFLKEQLRETSRQTYILLIQSYLHIKNFPQALVAAKDAIGLDFDEPATFYYDAGLALYGQGNYQGSLPFLKQSVELDTGLADGYYYLGQALKAQGEENLAAQMLRRGKKEHQLHPRPKPEDEIELRIF
jgi:tetratricopeptide (TPR) repeat protein